MKLVSEAIETFKSEVVRLKTGETYVYHVGRLAEDAASSPATCMIGMLARGLHLMGRVSLRQRRDPMGPGKYEYSFKVLAPINGLDFDIARKTHLVDLGL